MYTPIKQPADGQALDTDNRTYNAVLRGLRCRGERVFALLTGRWRSLRYITASPSRIGDIVKASPRPKPVSLHLVQAGRPDPWVPGRTRELMISLTCPAQHAGRYPLAPYLESGAWHALMSLGGATAAATMRDDPRIKAGIDLDGDLFGPVVTTGLSPARAITIESTYVDAFFDQQLRHHPEHLLDGPSQRFPEMVFVP